MGRGQWQVGESVNLTYQRSAKCAMSRSRSGKQFSAGEAIRAVHVGCESPLAELRPPKGKSQWNHTGYTLRHIGSP